MITERLYRASARITLAAKRAWHKQLFAKLTQRELAEHLKCPDPETVDLLWRAFALKVKDLRNLMVIIYDDQHEYPMVIRNAAADYALNIIKMRFGGGHVFLPGSLWEHPSEGRVAYLLGIVSYLPHKLRQCKEAAQRLMSSEQAVFADSLR